jgi:hypothetical protein
MNSLLVMTAEALYWRIRYVDSNPDVGMGPFPVTLLNKILEETNVDLNERQIQYVLEFVESRKQNERF